MRDILKTNKIKKLSKQEINVTLEVSDELIEEITQSICKEVSKKIQEFLEGKIKKINKSNKS